MDENNKNILITFEMANNHMGDLAHGYKIVDELKRVSSKFPQFDYSVKLQYRDDSFFHKDHIDRKDHKLIKRFTETRLGENGFLNLVDYIREKNFITMCTPWDEKAVEFLKNSNIEIMKIASCSFNDWDLLERVSLCKQPVIASTAGAKKIDIDKVYSLFKNKNKKFSLMHCVGEYPTKDVDLQLNQIDFLKRNYPDCKIGFSTHENPENYDSVKLALAKGAKIFEKHVGVPDDNKKYVLNPYSANPHQIEKWLNSMVNAINMLGSTGSIRKSFSKKENDDLRILHRGAYAKKIIKKDEILSKNYYLAMPNIENQLVAKDMGMFQIYKAKKDINIDEPLMNDDFENSIAKDNSEEIKFLIKDKLKNFLSTSKVVLPTNVVSEINHHHGIEKFFEYGAILIHLINKEYSKIIVVMFPGQKYPKHYHSKKKETYYILHGDLEVDVQGKRKKLYPGDMMNVDNSKEHSFSTDNGVIFEEIATTYIKGDSKYINEVDEKRKTELKLF